MASLQRGLQLLRRSALRHRVLPVITQSRAGSGGPSPPIKPPGPEWVDKGWKDDGTGFGDYPNYQEFSYQDRDPRPVEPYFDAQDRRYYGEPIHVNDDMLNMWMPDSTDNGRFTPFEMFLHLSTAMGLLGLLALYSEFVHKEHEKDPAVAKVYPYNNLYLEMGGDPEKEPTEEDLKRRIPTPHYGF